MFRLSSTVLVAFVACTYASTLPLDSKKQMTTRIAGGEDASIYAFPYQVSIQRDGVHGCGGTLIKNNYVLSAAHCFSGNVAAGDLQVRLGSSTWTTGGTVVGIKSYTTHPNYKTGTFENDIAVVKLARPVYPDLNMNTIDMATTEPVNGTAAVASGWGITKQGEILYKTNLQAVSLRIITNENCKSSDYDHGAKIRAGMFCASEFNSDSCRGDSGGPLVSEGKLVGVVSWGIGCNVLPHKYPGVYTQVSHYLSWIKENTN